MKMELRIDDQVEKKIEVRVTPEDGCVLLGKDEYTATCNYATRYHIMKRAAQRHYVSYSVLYEDIAPCCNPDYMPCKDRFWGCIRSEIFLLHLHILIIVFGLLKVFVHTQYDHIELHLIHAVIETTLACSVVIIRAFLGKEKFHEIKETRLKVEYVRVTSDTRSYAVKVWTFMHFAVSFLLCTVIIGSFVVCYLYLNLGWTILTNNLCVVLATFISNVTLTRLDRMIAQITEDQRKILIHESALLLGELYWAQSRPPNQCRDTRYKVERFLKGLKDTAVFHKPDYIECGEEQQLDIITSVESGV